MSTTQKTSTVNDRKLGWHLLLLVIIKIVILYGLWAVFIKPNKVKVGVSDVQRMYQGQSTSPSDVQFNQSKGVKHD